MLELCISRHPEPDFYPVFLHTTNPGYGLEQNPSSAHQGAPNILLDERRLFPTEARAGECTSLSALLAAMGIPCFLSTLGRLWRSYGDSGNMY